MCEDPSGSARSSFDSLPGTPTLRGSIGGRSAEPDLRVSSRRLETNEALDVAGECAVDQSQQHQGDEVRPIANFRRHLGIGLSAEALW